MGQRVRVPSVLSGNLAESAACALGMILAHYEHRTPLAQLVQACGPDASAANPAPLLQAAKSFRLDASLRRVDAAAALGATMPAIVALDQGRFAVLEGTDGKLVWVNTPAEGVQEIDAAAFARRYAGMLVEVSPSGSASGESPPSSQWQMIRERIEGGVGAAIVIFISSIMLLLPSLAMPAFSQVFIDMILIRNMNNWLLPVIVGLMFAAFITFFATGLQQHFMKRLEGKIGVVTQVQMFWRTLTAPVLYYNKVAIGDVVSRLAGAPRVASLLSSRLATNFSNVITAGFYLLILLVYSLSLGLITLFLTSLNVFVVKLVNAKRGAVNRRQLQQVAQSYSVAVNGFRAIESMKSMAMESFFFTKQVDVTARTIDSQQRVDSLSMFLNLAPAILTAVNAAVILTYGATLVIGGELTLGQLLAFQMLAVRFARPVQDLMTASQEMSELSARLASCDAILHAPEDPVTRARTNNPSAERLSGHIELRNVTFGYDRDGPPLIENLSLTIAPGSRVAIAGGSGSGKSTLGKIILGLYDVQGGAVLYDGKPVNEIPRSIWAASVGYVAQDVTLIEGTVRDNFTLWDETIPLADVRQAARDAEIDDVISTRTGGYDGPVREGGSNFSGGQRQRIEIGRALVRNPRILVLDEAVAALDAATEARVDRNLRRRGCTSVIIAHRLSTLRDADEILVLEAGRLVERGTHDELVRKDGRYAQLIRLA